MGFIIEINDHLDVELRRESFIVHDDELYPSQEAPEFHYKRVYPMLRMLQHIEESERFQRWLAKAEERHYDGRCAVRGYPAGGEHVCELQRGHPGSHRQRGICWLGYHTKHAQVG